MTEIDKEIDRLKKEIDELQAKLFQKATDIMANTTAYELKICELEKTTINKDESIQAIKKELQGLIDQYVFLMQFSSPSLTHLNLS